MKNSSLLKKVAKFSKLSQDASLQNKAFASLNKVYELLNNNPAALTETAPIKAELAPLASDVKSANPSLLEALKKYITALATKLQIIKASVNSSVQELYPALYAEYSSLSRTFKDLSMAVPTPTQGYSENAAGDNEPGNGSEIVGVQSAPSQSETGAALNAIAECKVIVSKLYDKSGNLLEKNRQAWLNRLAALVGALKKYQVKLGGNKTSQFKTPAAQEMFYKIQDCFDMLSNSLNGEELDFIKL